ncbi:MAG: methyl-accepting chemotaxis protein [Candidatus Caldatribacteriaceae bacterium]
MRNLRVGIRILLGFFIAIALSVVVGYLGIRVAETIFEDLTQIFAVRLPNIDYILEIDRDLQQLLVAERSLIFIKTDSEIFQKLVEEYETNLNQSMDRWEKYKTLATSPEELAIIPLYEKSWEEWLALSRQVVEERKADTREGRTLALDLTLGKAKEKFEEMRNYIDQLTEINLNLAAKEEQQARESYKQSILFVSVTIGALIGISLMIAGLVTRGITKPLAQMVQVTREVAEGNLKVQLETHSQDEVGVLGGALRTMVANLRSLVEQILGDASALAKSSVEISSSVQQVSQATQEIAKAVSQMAQGSAEQSGELAAMSHRTDLIKEKTQTLLEGTTRNLKLLGEVRESIEGNTKALREIEKNVQLTAEAGERTTQEAEKGNQSLAVLTDSVQSISRSTRDVTQSIGTLENRSQEIGKIVDLITSIAEQTNLLALNAAIEAARAGEAGRGFAVVAEEVRKLAENSAQAAQQIARLIEEIRGDTRITVERVRQAEERVTEGVSQAQEVSINLGNIMQAIKQVVTRIEDMSRFFEEATRNQDHIAHSIEEVVVLSEDNAKLIKDITSSIVDIAKETSSVASVAEENASSSEEISASTEEQSASLEEITSAVESLAEMAKRLQASVDKFKI